MSFPLGILHELGGLLFTTPKGSHFCTMQLLVPEATDAQFSWPSLGQFFDRSVVRLNSVASFIVFPLK